MSVQNHGGALKIIQLRVRQKTTSAEASEKRLNGFRLLKCDI